jgi:hypothetical protein
MGFFSSFFNKDRQLPSMYLTVLRFHFPSVSEMVSITLFQVNERTSEFGIANWSDMIPIFF